MECPFPSSIHHPVFLDGCAKGGCRKERFALPVAENALPLCPLGENKAGRDTGKALVSGLWMMGVW